MGEQEWTLTLEDDLHQTGDRLWVIRDPEGSWVGEGYTREDLLLAAENLAEGAEVRAVELREEADDYQDTADGIRNLQTVRVRALVNRTNKETP